ncbi:MAG: FtsX-like permease family protein, partial [Candidatus Dormibacteria bacterium]
HTLISSARRRRRELAILKTVGFVRRQVMAAVAWQAATITGIAVVVGIPVGIAAGRWAWTFFADQQGLVTDPAVPPATLVLLVPASLALAVIIAAFPARVAAATHPAEMLRAE